MGFQNDPADNSIERLTINWFQKDSYYAIERLTIECRKTKTKVITLANHRERKQRQSDRGENTFQQVTNEGPVLRELWSQFDY